jgi:hypothetical protein
MAKCALCGAEVDERNIAHEYIEENDSDDSLCYCFTCREFLKTKKGVAESNPKNIRKVKIESSDYYLPGFVRSKDGTHFVRKKKNKD